MAALSVEDVVRGTQGALVAGDLAVPVTGISIDSRIASCGETDPPSASARARSRFSTSATSRSSSAARMYTPFRCPSLA